MRPLRDASVRLYRGDQQGNKQADNGDYNKQFDQRERGGREGSLTNMESFHISIPLCTRRRDGLGRNWSLFSGGTGLIDQSRLQRHSH